MEKNGLWDKSWEWPGDEANHTIQLTTLRTSVRESLQLQLQLLWWLCSVATKIMVVIVVSLMHVDVTISKLHVQLLLYLQDYGCKVASSVVPLYNYTLHNHSLSSLSATMQQWLKQQFVLAVNEYNSLYAATTLTLSTVFHSKPRCHANMATLEMPICSTCSETFSGSLSPKA